MTTCAPYEAPTSDAALLDRVAELDEAAFELLYQRHAAACARRARAVLATDEWVADVVQAVFLDLWRHGRRFDPGRGSVRSWLLGLTHHKAVDVVRVQARHASRRASDDLLGAHEDPSPDPEQQVTAADLAGRLRRAVAEVGPVERQVLELCFLQGRTQREASELLAIPLGTVKTRSQRAVQVLARTLDREQWR